MSGGESSDEESAGGGSSEEFIQKHRCTDHVCLVGFLGSIGVLVYIFLWGAWHGNVAKLSHGLNEQGQICGVSPAVAESPYLYYCSKELSAAQVEVEDGGQSLKGVLDSLLNGSSPVHMSQPVCVSQCPQEATNIDDGDKQIGPEFVQDCSPQKAYPTEVVGAWYCFPAKRFFSKASKKIEAEWEKLFSADGWNFFGAHNSWPVLLMVVFAATVLGYFYLFLLRALAKGLLLACACVSILALMAGGYYMWKHATADIKAAGVETGLAMETASTDDLTSIDWYARAFAILLWLLALGVSCLVCCCSGEIELSTSCVQTGTDVMFEMPLLLLSPLLKALVKAAMMVIFLVGFIFLWSTADVTGKGQHREYTFTGTQKLYIAIYAVIAWWILCFITALYQFAIAYAVAKWYDAHIDETGLKDVDFFGIIEGVRVGLCYHAGSLAFGAAIITALELFQKVLEYADLKNKEEGNNEVVACVLHCILCCCKCVEGIVQFISKNVYIDIAITSDGFCRSVQNIAHVMIDHGAAMAILNGATVIFQVVGMVAINACCGFMANFLLTNGAYADDKSGWYVSNPLLATIVATVLSIIVSWSFMAVFDMTTDTLLICYAEDQRRNGTAKHASDKMNRLFQKAKERAAQKRQRQEKELNKLKSEAAKLTR